MNKVQLGIELNPKRLFVQIRSKSVKESRDHTKIGILR